MSHDPPAGKAPEVPPLSVEQLEAEFRSPPPELVEAYANLSDDPATGTD